MKRKTISSFLTLLTCSALTVLANPPAPATSVATLTEADFASVVGKNQTLPVLVSFGAKWCVPCKRMDPILEELAEESQGRAVIAKVDVQKSLALAIRYDAADALPTICVFRAGEVIKKAVGFHDLGELRGLLQDQ